MYTNTYESSPFPRKIKLLNKSAMLDERVNFSFPCLMCNYVQTHGQSSSLKESNFKKIYIKYCFP